MLYKQLDTTAHHFFLFIFNVNPHQATGGRVEIIEKDERRKLLREFKKEEEECE